MFGSVREDWGRRGDVHGLAARLSYIDDFEIRRQSMGEEVLYSSSENLRGIYGSVEPGEELVS